MKLEIDKRAYNSILNFSRIIYKNAIINKEDLPNNEQIIKLYYKNKFVAKAIYDSGAPTIKILTLKDEEINKDFFYNRIKKAKDYRENVLNYKDTYRMIYAEADYLPSIIIDRYNDIASMQVSSKIIEGYSRIIFECLEEIADINTLYVQNAKKGDKIIPKIYGDKKFETVIKEGNAKFKVNLKGHKTGFFLDQRENRMDLENYIKKGDKVLDICCYTGGFSVHCGIKGAEVIGVDMSNEALKVAEENMTLNNIKHYNFIEGNAFDIMRDMINKNEKFDVVILDPPAFTKSSKDVKNALKAYNTLNYLGLKLAKRMFITSSCSHHIDREMFKNMVVSSSLRAKKEIRQIGGYRTQSPDHIITMTNKNLEYLKCLFFGVNNL
ncbi:class I SAM-dependent rRNA methyltransferase [Methanothermococcus okinawensis]|uniref:class I SAM-dependent rRNA methyltransferase n=1 Tax=Methanothermococcus okinawensis TaxID=155863 RepID=UPI0012F651CD|nr:class I SAM-dependent rRNA methyltransferase [Methanothermococcus okinawensis]